MSGAWTLIPMGTQLFILNAIKNDIKNRLWSGSGKKYLTPDAVPLHCLKSNSQVLGTGMSVRLQLRHSQTLS